ncbi:ComEA family DNA-binding protein [Roseivirga sp.]|uniref:ComEA family DNA-binding protein n=1 Tax=Roseivirga sp. TaxID=1964215 RepID=UPI002B26B1D0|nr:helix-hairpin-helix domain-containing protein [Roseivirga sp.]
MINIKRLVRNYFGFSKTQTNGFMVLAPLIFVMLFAPSVYRRVTQFEYNEFDSDKRQLDSLVALWSNSVKIKVEEGGIPKMDIRLTSFNPNTATSDELIRVGLDQRLASRIGNYLNAGGSFKVKSDLKRIYGFPDSLYLVLEPYIQLPNELPQRINRKEPFEKPLNKERKLYTEVEESVSRPEFFVLDINEADSLAFQRLKGIGPAYSSRIVKFRQLLGGFSSVDQIKEVFGISDSLYQSIASRLEVNEVFRPAQININLATFKEINAHPYISYEQTKEIMNAKSKYGKFKSLADLNRLALFDSIQIVKLSPYLQFQ